MQIEHCEEESIFSILGRMNLLLEYFSASPKYKYLVPFLYTYYTVTKEVATRSIMQKNSSFENIPALHQLDVYFASLYINPLHAFMEDSKKTSPWKTYFEYCTTKKANPFLQMLLGINAHINGDLPVCVYTLQYTEKKDYEHINHVLEELIPKIMFFLATEYRDVLGLSGLLFPQLTSEEFQRIIVQWRNQAWENGHALIEKNSDAGIAAIHQQTEEIAQQLIRLFSNKYTLLKERNTLRSLRVKI